MKLWELLVQQECKCLSAATDILFKNYLKNSKEYDRYMGRQEMCELLAKMLSDETLNMEVKTRTEVLVKGGTK